MSLAANKILLANATTNTAGAYFETTTVVAASTGNGTLVPTGLYWMAPTANVTVLVYDGSANSTYIANNVGGVIFSDGINVRVKASSGNANVTLIQVNEGQAVSGTFNS